jgi:sulfate adenylyltransferase
MREIDPHGGKLVNRVVQWEGKAPSYKRLILNRREIQDLEMLAVGAFSPLEGFMLEGDYTSVLEEMRLENGTVWTIPITLSATHDEVKGFKEGEEIALDDEKGTFLGILHLEQIYKYDKEKEAKLIYKTLDPSHPGVKYLYSCGEFLLGGKITLMRTPEHKEFKEYWFTPAQTRKAFKERGWRRVVGFQMRNPIHRAHEFIIKCAMEIVDGLFLNPLVGETKEGDIPADVRMACYKALVERYFPRDRVFIGVYSAAMRYAGPREAILHAIVRKNFGCTHFIVGRDHAGVGSFYGPFDAQYIFDEFNPEELGITPLFFDNAFYCRRCHGMATVKTCPHSKNERLSFSGTKVRELLRVGELPPPEFTRPEVANILLKWWRTVK